MAIDENYDYCILFDQDSQASPNLINIVSNYLVSGESDKIGIFAAVPHYLVGKIKDAPKNEYVDVAITSGSLLSLKVYKIVGPFNDKLFIDYVDFEYCLRIRKAGFKILRLKEALIYHKLGDLKRKIFLFKKIFVTNHPPVRYYYRTRNRFYVYKKYFLTFPLFVIKDLIIFINELIKIIFFESNRGEKLHMIKKGLFDFILGRYGKLG